MKRLFYKCLFTAFLICVGVYGKAQERWISFDSSTDRREPTIEVINSNNTEHYVKITFHGMYVEDVEQNGIMYRKLSFGNMYTTTGIVGEPALPVVSQLIAIPNVDDCTCSILKMDSVDISIGAICPFLEPVPESKTQIFVKNDNVYNAALYDSPVFRKGELQIYRKIKNRSIAVCPFKYYPHQGKLTVYRSVYVRLKYNSTDSNFIPFSKYTKKMSKAIFDNSFELSLENSDTEQMDKSEVYDYLIIVGDDSTLYNSAALKEFCKWKAYKGFKTKVVSTKETGSSSLMIRRFIESEYEKADIKYVLLIGDADRIPLYTGDVYSYSVTVSDYWYGCMDGINDIQADIAIGRFATNKFDELENIIYKSIAYENTRNANAQKVLLMAHKEKRFRDCLNGISDSIYSTPVTFVKAYGGVPDNDEKEAKNADIIENINHGLNIVNYRGHGGPDLWYHWNTDYESFSYSEISSLTNTIYPIVFSIACETSDFKDQTCIMDSFMCSPNGAAVFLGATIPTYGPFNDEYNAQIYRNLFGSSSINKCTYGLGELNVRSLILAISNNASESAGVYNAFSYVCAGDPSLEIFTQPAKTFSNVAAIRDSHNVLVGSSSVNDFSVSVVSSEGKLIDYVQAVNSSVTLSNVPYDAHIVLNKHNYIPCEVECEAAYIQNENFADEQTVVAKKIEVGKDVTPYITFGDVIVNNGASLKLNSRSATLIKNGFECNKGGVLIIE